MTDLEKALDNQDALVLLTGAVNVKGVLHSEVSFTGSATWNSEESGEVELINSAASGIQSFVNTLFPEAAQRFPTLFGKQGRLQTAAGSNASWAGSSCPELMLDLIFISVAGEDVRQDIAKLQKCVYPESITVGGFGLGAIITPPLGFKRGGFGETAGRIRVQVGRILKTSQIFVMSSVDARFSQSVTKGGLPLYAQAVISLKASRIVDAKEVGSWMT